ncbi:AfsR/SARP family transcriptional regulator [Streptomyces sp. NBC_00988]|uniref:AfsR/SARP family transcriptional regulator n=1 Tax=Streptomyces sp. NBC_00988 TaxID=2903704 RepID=UPI00386B74E7|nr:AfsR/SARP family transcriptional regulator [Streptomyces sp. NBC_00988]
MRFRLLGRLELVTANGAVVPPGAVSRAIVGRLLLAHGAVVQRDTLVDELWEERTTKNPVGALQVQMAKLRVAFAARGEDTRLLFDHGGYRIVLGPEDEVDVPDFEAAVRDGREHLAADEYEKAESELRRGLSMWRGRALDGLEGRAFETERTRLEDLRLGALEDAATTGLELGRAKELIPELQALLSLAPLRERSRARLMLALYRCGRFAEALEVYDTGRRLLKSELGAAPGQELRSLHAAILRHDPSLQGRDPSRQWRESILQGRDPSLLGTVTLPGRPSSPRTDVREPASVSTSGEGNLSRPLGPFVGRRKELTSLCEVVGRERLVTVLGPGGVGKTRLALEVCALVQPSRGNVWWVDLAPADDANVLAVVASALGLSDTSVRPDQPPHDYVHRLTSFLAGRSAVLALDNCEHLLDAVAPLVATLLSRCPALTVLTTSRAPLEVAAEVLYPLAPMPDEEAADLFGTRAAMIDPSFAPDAAALHDIRRLCRRLDGLPLAVELAAAHVRLLTVREIEARLDNRFTLLIKGERTAPARHRTLRAVLDWSYALLDTTEQRLLTELALYVGGCSLDIVEAATPLPGADSAELLHVLGQLVDKSLLVPVSTPDGNRLRMLETVREYALTRLREEGRAPEAEERLMTWAARFVREGSAGLSSRDQREWARRLTEESANIRAASDLMTARSRAAEALLLEARLGYFWFISGREEEGIDRLQRGLQAYDATAGERTAEPTEDDEWALFYTIAWLTWLHHVAGHHREASSYVDRHKEAWHYAKNPDLAVLGRCYDALHAMLNGHDDVEERFALGEAAVVDTEFHWDRAVLQTNWSTYCLQHGDTEGARRHGLIAVAASRAADDDFARVFSLTLCGDADESDGLRARAREQWAEAARILGAVGARTRWAYVLLRLVCLDITEREFAAAEERLADVSRLADELSADDLQAAVANLRGVLAVRGGRFAEAERILHGVWRCPGAPPDRRAVAAVGLAVIATFGPPTPTAADDARAWIDRGRQTHAGLLEPLARHAVGVLLDRLDARHGAKRPGETHQERDWLADSPSVLAAFS